jgi:hypothetical protein
MGEPKQRSQIMQYVCLCCPVVCFLEKPDDGKSPKKPGNPECSVCQQTSLKASK